jgi:hypothetical protein
MSFPLANPIGEDMSVILIGNLGKRDRRLDRVSGDSWYEGSTEGPPPDVPVRKVLLRLIWLGDGLHACSATAP